MTAQRPTYRIEGFEFPRRAYLRNIRPVASALANRTGKPVRVWECTRHGRKVVFVGQPKETEG